MPEAFVPTSRGKPKTPETILRRSANKFIRLQRQSDIALENRDEGIARKKLRKAGKVIVFLPHKLQKAVEQGHKFPEDAMARLIELSQEANGYLEQQSYYGLRYALLTPRTRQEIFGPNLLENLIYDLYPPKPLAPSE